MSSKPLAEQSTIELCNMLFSYIKKSNNVKIGDSGTLVELIQIRLNEQGFSCGAVDGVFGVLTQSALLRFQGAHIGPTGEFLCVNGEANSATIWALCEPVTGGQRNNLSSGFDGITSLRRNKILSLAFEYHSKGVREIPNGSNRSPEIDKWTGREGRPESEKGPPWCAYFVCGMVVESIGFYPWQDKTKKTKLGSAYKIMKMAQDTGRWHDNDGSYVPKSGDIYVIQYRNDLGARTYSGHTGFVTRVDKPNFTKVNTISGNEGNRVKHGTRDTGATTHGGHLLMMGFVNLFGDVTTPSYGLVSASASDSSLTR